MISFTPIPMIDKHGNIITSFSINGVTMMLSQDIEAAEEYLNKLRAAIEKVKKDRVDTAPAMPCM
jgi:ArsR family metal-binding transcriptional regulator